MDGRRGNVLWKGVEKKLVCAYYEGFNLILYNIYIKTHKRESLTLLCLCSHKGNCGVEKESVGEWVDGLTMTFVPVVSCGPGWRCPHQTRHPSSASHPPPPPFSPNLYDTRRQCECRPKLVRQSLLWGSWQSK